MNTLARSVSIFTIAFVAIAAMTSGTSAKATNSDPYLSRDYGFRIDGGKLTSRPVPLRGTDQFAVVFASPEGWQVQVRVAPIDPASSPQDLRIRALDRIRRNSSFKLRESSFGTLTGVRSPFLEVDYRMADQSYRISAHFRVENDLRYIIQASAPAGAWSRFEPAIRSVLGSFECLPVRAELRTQYRLDGLAARCGSEITWEPTWQAAAIRAGREQKPILLVAHEYRGFDITNAFSTGAFFDPDIIELVRTRLVPLRLEKGDPTPLSDHDRYGLGAQAFGRALILVEPDGTVLAETFRSDAVTVDAFLRRTLAVRDAARQKVGGHSTLELESMAPRQLFNRGHLEQALASLNDANSVGTLRLRADTHRRLRQGEAALADLARISKQAGSRRPDIAVDEAILHARMSSNSEARRLLRDFVQSHPRDSRTAEAEYWLSLLDLSEGDFGRSRTRLESIIAHHSGNRWSWKAAATLTSTGFELKIIPDLSWPDEGSIRALDPGVLAPRGGVDPKNPESLAQDAVRFLVETQRSDGGWLYPATLGASSQNPPQPIELAVNALAASSLIPYRDQPGVKAAIHRTLDCLRTLRARSHEEPARLHFMDYWVWAQCYHLDLTLRCLAAEVGPETTLRALAQELVQELIARQRSTGGWSYYLKRDLASTQEDSQSISFVTAPVVHVLLDAQEQGFAVPNKVLGPALDCLEAMHRPNGSFDYMGGLGTQGSPGRVPGAAGRGPLCAHALYRAGRRSAEDVAHALELFAQHSAALAREQGKNLMHAGPDAQGSHYLLFDYATAARAVSALPTPSRGRFAALIHTLIAETRYEDGGYLDNPSMGKTSGTGLALLAFDALSGRTRD